MLRSVVGKAVRGACSLLTRSVSAAARTEAVPTLQALELPYSFVRLQSSLCEAQAMEKLCLELDANLLVARALRAACCRCACSSVSQPPSSCCADLRQRRRCSSVSFAGARTGARLLRRGLRLAQQEARRAARAVVRFVCNDQGSHALRVNARRAAPNTHAAAPCTAHSHAGMAWSS